MRLLAATFLFLRHATGYYIDGVAPQSFGRGDLYVNLAEILSERQHVCIDNGSSSTIRCETRF
jgi:hypothetical protein